MVHRYQRHSRSRWDTFSWRCSCNNYNHSTSPVDSKVIGEWLIVRRPTECYDRIKMIQSSSSLTPEDKWLPPRTEEPFQSPWSLILLSSAALCNSHSLDVPLPQYRITPQGVTFCFDGYTLRLVARHLAGSVYFHEEGLAHVTKCAETGHCVVNVNLQSLSINFLR